MADIVGSISIDQSVDHNGSLLLDVPIHLPPANLLPQLGLSYHSASKDVDNVGFGWVVKGPAVIERIGATLAQDGVRGSVKYDKDDQFSLNGQRLIKIADNEYRYELEQWSKITTTGSDPANPESWTEHLADGTVRYFGRTADSNIKAQGQQYLTRAWAVCELADPFTNYVTYRYTNDSVLGSFHISDISYGGNKNLGMLHQRSAAFNYEDRPDVNTRFIGGYQVQNRRRLQSISALVKNTLAHKYTLRYNLSPLTGRSRLISVALSDATGARVNPLEFKWNDADEAVFDALKPLPTLPAGSTKLQCFPLDYAATGRNDIVVTSMRFNPASKADELYTEVYLSSADGSIAPTPAPGSGFTGLLAPLHILPIDVNGDGRTDLLHIRQMLSGSTTNHTFTALLSTPDGYKKQVPTTYKPESLQGRYFTGDFAGNGRVGLIYVYNVQVDNKTRLRFVQFDSDGTTLEARAPVDGPDLSVQSVRIVTGDLNGNGAEDVFLISPVISGSLTTSHIDLLESQNGRLVYRSDKPLAGVGETVPFLSTTTFHPYAPGGDGQTGLLVLSNNQGKLQYQILRSTGVGLTKAAPPIQTDLLFSGNATLASTTAPDSVDLLHTFQNAQHEFQVNILRFQNNVFKVIPNVAQPKGVPAGASVTVADVRGTGRAGLLFTKVGADGNIAMATLPCALPQAADFLSGYKTGLGLVFKADYAPLTDPSTYSSSGAGTKSTTAAINAMARNISSSASISPSGSSASSSTAHSRVALVHFPKYVVKHISTCAHPTRHPDVLYEESYFYENARLAFDGRGWLGFETVKKTIQPTKIATTSTYIQAFPLLGRTSKVETREAGNQSKLLQVNHYGWNTTAAAHNKNQFIALSRLTENHYEDGSPSFSVEVSHKYDAFGNTVETIIDSPNLRKKVTVQNSYTNDEKAWILGNKTSEHKVSWDGATARATFDYLPGSQKILHKKSWIAGDTWALQSYKYNQVGNPTQTDGPGRQSVTIAYDETCTFPKSTATAVGPNEDALIEEREYDLANGHVTSVTDPSGHVTTTTYDILGRELTVSEGDERGGMLVMETQLFEARGSDFVNVHRTRCDWAIDSWKIGTNYVDGLGRSWRMEAPKPDDPTKIVRKDTYYDGAGRTYKYTDQYVSTSQPAFTTCTYDCQSRMLKSESPSANENSDPIVTSYTYEFIGGQLKVSEVQTGSSPKGRTEVIRELDFLPNPDFDSAQSQYVRHFVGTQTNALGQKILMTYDGFGRAVKVEDPSGVMLTVAYDGTNRQIERRIANPAGVSPPVISHFAVTYDDEHCAIALENKLTGSAIRLQKDYAGRPLSRTSSDETLTYTYDRGTVNGKGHLSSVSSSLGHAYAFEYNPYGLLSSSNLAIDGHIFRTTLEWTPTRKLASITHPDGSFINNSFFEDSDFVRKTQAISGEKKQVSVAFEDIDIATSRPRLNRLGNGLTSSTTTNALGIPTSISLTDGQGTCHKQLWDVDGVGRINAYTKSHRGEIEPLKWSYSYDDAGQLIRATSTNHSKPSVFSYDHSSNLTDKDEIKMITKGWQLDRLEDLDGNLHLSFDYSVDGNLIAVRDSSGATIKAMKYNATGQLSDVNGTTFTYDFKGRLIKAIRKDGTVTWYPSDSCEIVETPSGSRFGTTYITDGGRRASVTTVLAGEHQNEYPVLYYHHDHTGSVVAVTDVNGKIVCNYSYDPFGKAQVDGADVSRYKFSGKEEFEGLYYFGARFYDPQTGRFLTLDNFDISFNDISPSTFNQYAFSRNDPVNYIDVNGNVPWWHWLVDIGMIIGGVVIIIASGGSLSLLGEAFIGGGISGLQCDIIATINGRENDNTAWVTGIAVGMLMSVAGAGLMKGVGFLGGKLTKFVKPESWVGKLLNFVTKSAKGAPGPGTPGGFLGKLAWNAVSGAATGVIRQEVENIIQGRSWDYGLKEAAVTGAITGFLVTGVIGGGSTRLAYMARESERAYQQANPFPKLLQAAARGRANEMLKNPDHIQKLTSLMISNLEKRGQF